MQITKPKKAAVAPRNAATTDASSPRNGVTVADASASIEQTLKDASDRAGADILKLPAAAQRAIAEGGGYQQVAVGEIDRSADNRKDFDPDKMAELVSSVRTHGVLQPITLRKLASGRYEIVIGERRWRAAKVVGLKTIPAVVRECDDRTGEELRLTENLQREDLNPMDEARGYQRLQQLGLSIDEIGKKLGGISKTVIYARLALLELPKETLDAVKSGKIKASVAELITRADDPAAQRELTKAILNPSRHADKEGGTLSFRAAKDLVDDAVDELKDRRAWEKEMTANSGQLRKVLDFDASAKLMPWSHSPPQGFLKLSDCCYSDPKRRNYETLLRKSEIEVTICRNSNDGTPIKLVRQKDAAAAIVAAGHEFTIGEGSEPVDSNKEKGKARAKRERAKVNRTIFPTVIKEAVTVGARLGWTADLARFWAHQYIDTLSMKKAEFIVKRRGIEETNTAKWTPGKILHAHADDYGAKDNLGLILEIKLLNYEPYDFGTQPWQAGMEKLTAALKVDAKAIERKFRALAPEAPASACPGRRHLAGKGEA